MKQPHYKQSEDSKKPDVLIQLEKIRPTLVFRDSLICEVRKFFRENAFIEIETPVRIASPAPETHIDPIASDGKYLRTSPELQMKALVCAGFEKIFQIGPCFRKSESGRLHNEEFTMLEWYETGIDYLGLLDFTKRMLARLQERLGDYGLVEKTGLKAPDFSKEWVTFTVKEAFAKFADIPLEEAVRKDLFEEMLVTRIEPRLPKDRPAVLKDYPAKFAAFSKLDKDNPAFAQRWELYLRGIEIANAYSELVDPDEQLRRFIASSEERKAAGKETPELDMQFMDSIRYGMPECAGCALGIDRLVMVMAGAQDIGEVMFDGAGRKIYLRS